LVENSFEHGLQDKEGQWVLSVATHLSDSEELVIQVKDNGVGIENDLLQKIRNKINQDTAQAMKAGSHIGLGNVQARIKLRSQNENHGLSIHSTPQEGTTITVRMPAMWEGGMINGT
jgi:two-component system sensor histidine kinase YesM